ncbi:MAG: SsrA-binding protein SmpB [Pseudomonadota bacterium]
MAKSNQNTKDNKVIIVNKRSRFEYFIEETIEAGIVLKGSEVKSLRDRKVNIMDSYCSYEKNELFLINSNIASYKQANIFNHSPTRPRKLLLHRTQINKLSGKIQRKGYSLIPLSLYFNKKNIVKIELGLAKGKKLHDKRHAIKERDWNRDKERAMKQNI